MITEETESTLNGEERPLPKLTLIDFNVARSFAPSYRHDSAGQAKILLKTNTGNQNF